MRNTLVIIHTVERVKHQTGSAITEHLSLKIHNMLVLVIQK